MVTNWIPLIKISEAEMRSQFVDNPKLQDCVGFPVCFSVDEAGCFTLWPRPDLRVIQLGFRTETVK